MVDRTANIPLAAKGIVEARLFANGTSPYSPDLVIVNEWTSEAFRKACFDYAASLANDRIHHILEEQDRIQQKIKSAESKGQIKVHNSVPGLTFIEVVDR